MDDPPQTLVIPPSKFHLSFFSSDNLSIQEKKAKKINRTHKKSLTKQGGKPPTPAQNQKRISSGELKSIKQQINKNIANNQEMYYTYFHEQRGKLYITINDSGIGISPSQQLLLFNPYQQACIEITKKYGGSGLGLWISKRIINEMKGEIFLSSQLGFGTSLKIEIPLEVQQKQIKEIKLSELFTPTLPPIQSQSFIQLPINSILNQDSLEPQSAQIRQPKKKLSLNLFDKKEQMQVILADNKLKGYRLKWNVPQKIHQADSGKQLISMYQRIDNCKLIILSKNFDDMNGFQVCEQLRIIQQMKTQQSNCFIFLYIVMLVNDLREKERLEGVQHYVDEFSIRNISQK